MKKLLWGEPAHLKSVMVIFCNSLWRLEETTLATLTRLECTAFCTDICKRSDKLMQVWAAFEWTRPYPVFPAFLLLDLHFFIFWNDWRSEILIYDFYFFVKLIQISSNTNLSILTDVPWVELLKLLIVSVNVKFDIWQIKNQQQQNWMQGWHYGNSAKGWFIIGQYSG